MFTPLRRNVSIFNQRGGTIGWLVSPNGLLVVDTQFADTAPNLLAGLKARSPRQIDVLINSHHRPDHTGGNGVLRPAAKQIVAHVRSSENQKVQAERAKAVHRHAHRSPLPARLLHGRRGDGAPCAPRGPEPRRSGRRSKCCRSSSTSVVPRRGSAWR
ncbi:MAG: MBL fold metallo-hydrolase [Acidobacteria bacterium]|nr:MBL fold metallo-hydrolase [Acidobacteriota bacterium]